MRLPRFLAGFASALSAVLCAFAAFLASAFAIPADLLERVRMSIADHAAKLGRDLTARRRMFTLTFWQRDGGTSLLATALAYRDLASGPSWRFC